MGSHSGQPFSEIAASAKHSSLHQW